MEDLKNIAPLEEFNWDEYENGQIQTKATQEDQEKSYDSTLNKLNDGEVVDGTIISMNKREVVVNIGFKSDGVVSMA
jgi:small subunit ribosomal protein S1